MRQKLQADFRQSNFWIFKSTSSGRLKNDGINNHCWTPVIQLLTALETRLLQQSRTACQGFLIGNAWGLEWREWESYLVRLCYQTSWPCGCQIPEAGEELAAGTTINYRPSCASTCQIKPIRKLAISYHVIQQSQRTLSSEDFASHVWPSSALRGHLVIN